MQISHPVTSEQMKNAIKVIRNTWGRESPEHVFKDFLMAIHFHGGLILYATEDGIPIGIQVSVPAFRNGFSYLYSHITGVNPEYRESNIGYELKIHQRDWAIEHGFEMIAWTFDPSIAKNAYFNIEKLGVISRTFKEDFYGIMDDELNSGLPTDRLIVEWWVHEHTSVTGTHFHPVTLEDDLSSIDFSGQDALSVNIPYDFPSIKKEDFASAERVKQRLRMVLRAAVDQGFIVTGFRKEDSSYLMEHVSPVAANHPTNIFSS